MGITKVQKQPEIKTVIEIGKRIFVQKPLSANQYFEYEKRKIKQSVKIANEWLLYEAFEIDGHGVTEEDLKGLKFRDRGRLLLGLTAVDVTCNDDLPLSETSDFAVCSNRFTEKEDSGDYFDKFITKVAINPIDAYQWIIPKIILINERSITPEDFIKPAPDGIGFEGAATLTQWIQGFLPQAQGN